MQRLARTYAFVSLFSAVTAITLQSWVYRYFISFGQSFIPSAVVNALTASAVYVAIYKGLWELYKRWGWKKEWEWAIFKTKKIRPNRYLLEGFWYHECVDGSRPEYRRLGVTEVRQTFDSIKFKAQNYNEDFKKSGRSLWKSRAIEMTDDGDIEFSYSVERAEAGNDDDIVSKEGLMTIQIKWDKDGNPIQMDGIYRDCAPSDYRGSVTWRKHVPWGHHFEQASGISDSGKEQISGSAV